MNMKWMKIKRYYFWIIVTAVILSGPEMMFDMGFYPVYPQSVDFYHNVVVLEEQRERINDKIDAKNLVLEQCKAGEIKCTDAQKQEEPVPNENIVWTLKRLSRIDHWWQIIWVGWFLVVLCIWMIYDTIFPMAISYEQGRELRQGRVIYASNRPREYYTGDRMKAYDNIWKIDPMKYYRISTGTIIQGTSMYWWPERNKLVVPGQQLEYDKDGFLTNGTTVWNPGNLDIREIDRIIDDEMMAGEEMVRRGTRVNYQARRLKYNSEEISGEDIAGEHNLDRRRYE